MACVAIVVVVALPVLSLVVLLRWPAFTGVLLVFYLNMVSVWKSASLFGLTTALLACASV